MFGPHFHLHIIISSDLIYHSQEELRVPLLCSHRGLPKRPQPSRSQYDCPETSAMPGINFAAVRSAIPLADVLRLVGFIACETSGDQVRGPCPVHRSRSSMSRSFSANQRKHVYRCFTCGSSGNQLDLYASVTGLTVYEAAIALCKQFHREIPWTESARSEPQRSRPGNGPARADV
jgi:hypothetical protein